FPDNDGEQASCMPFTASNNLGENAQPVRLVSTEVSELTEGRPRLYRKPMSRPQTKTPSQSRMESAALALAPTDTWPGRASHIEKMAKFAADKAISSILARKIGISAYSVALMENSRTPVTAAAAKPLNAAERSSERNGLETTGRNSPSKARSKRPIEGTRTPIERSGAGVR